MFFEHLYKRRPSVLDHPPPAGSRTLDRLTWPAERLTPPYRTPGRQPYLDAVWMAPWPRTFRRITTMLVRLASVT